MICPACGKQKDEYTNYEVWQAHVATCQLDVLQRIAIALENTAAAITAIGVNGVAAKQ